MAANGKQSDVIGARGMSEFSDQLRKLMTVRGLGVRELSRRVPCNPGHVSQLRSGQKRPSAQTARRLDEVLDAGGMLAALAPKPVSRQTGGSVAAGRGFTDVPMRVRLTAFTAGQLDELISHLDDQWHALVKTDNLLGPRHALAGVRAQLSVIDALLRSVRLPAWQRVLRLGARYAESSAWLHEDSGGAG